MPDWASHEPARPTWKCTVDGDEWPCAKAKERMLRDYATVPLALTMSARYFQAIDDLGMVEGLHSRMLGWVRDQPTHAAEVPADDDPEDLDFYARQW